MKKFSGLFVLGAASMWGCSGIFVRQFNASGLFSQDICFLRMISGVFFVGIYMLLFQRDKFKVHWKDLWIFAGNGIVSILLFGICYYRVQTESLAVAGVLLYTSPIFVMLLSILLFHEKLTFRKFFAIALAFAGCVLAAGLGNSSTVGWKTLLIGLGAGLWYSLYSIFSRYAINRGYNGWTITFYSFIFCLIGACCIVDIPKVFGVLKASPVLYGWTAGMGMVTTCLPYILYIIGLKGMESSRASVMASLEMVVTAIIGFLFYDEKVTIPCVAGILLVLSAIAVLSTEQKKKTLID